MASKGAGNALLATETAIAALQWDSLLELQVATFLPYELHFLLSSASWEKARSVLDAGCGNGYYLAHLKRYFPDKALTGIDMSPELIAAARANPALSGASLHNVDITAFQPATPFEIVLLRLVVQHMQGFEPLFTALRRLVAPGGSVVIIEPEPSLFLNFPRTRRFEELLKAYAEETGKMQKNRAALHDLETVVGSLPGWRLNRNEVLMAPQVGPFASRPLMHIFTLWIDIFERSGALAFDFDGVRAELEEWSRRETAYSQLGLRFAEVARL
jgi:trans-aconitate methyltransferase